MSFAVGGRLGCTRARAAFTYSRVRNMSFFQSKNRLTSPVPRLVMERTVCKPGTLFMASSICRVTVTCI